MAGMQAHSTLETIGFIQFDTLIATIVVGDQVSLGFTFITEGVTRYRTRKARTSCYPKFVMIEVIRKVTFVVLLLWNWTRWCRC